MSRNRLVPRVVGGTLLLSGLALVVPGVAVSAVAAPGPASSAAVKVTPHTALSNGQSVSVSGSGLPSGGVGAIAECSSSPNQLAVEASSWPTPVSCTTPDEVHFDTHGDLRAVVFTVVSGTVGSPASRTDRSGTPAGTGTTPSPCPTPAARAASGTRCYLELTWGTGATESAFQTITFAPNKTVGAKSGTPRLSPTITVTPDAGLTNGQTVDVSATGLPDKGVGEIVECSSASHQPTVLVHGVPTPVSCTSPAAKKLTATAKGELKATFKIVSGTVGPPATGTDSAGHPAATDAKKYPCPATASQAAAGARCYLLLAWATGATDKVVVLLHTVTLAATTSTTKSTTTSTSTTATTSTTSTTTTVAGGRTGTSDTSGSSSTDSGSASTSGGSASGTAKLPYTGASFEQMALAGMALVILGSCLLLVGETPRRRARRQGC